MLRSRGFVLRPWVSGLRAGVLGLRSQDYGLCGRGKVHFQVHPVHVLFANAHPFIVRVINSIRIMGAHGAHAIVFLKRKRKERTGVYTG